MAAPLAHRTYNIQKLSETPDHLLGEVMQPSESRLSKINLHSEIGPLFVKISCESTAAKTPYTTLKSTAIINIIIIL